MAAISATAVPIAAPWRRSSPRRIWWKHSGRRGRPAAASGRRAAWQATTAPRSTSPPATPSAGTWMDGEAIIRLHPGLARSSDTHDFFTPSNWKALDNADQDLGGTEAIPIDIRVPGKSKRVIAFGKDGKAYLANRNNLGGIGGEIQNLQVANGGIR